MNQTFRKIVNRLLLAYCVYAIFSFLQYYFTHTGSILDSSHDSFLRLSTFALSIYVGCLLGWGLVRDALRRRAGDPHASRSMGVQARYTFTKSAASAWERHPIIFIIVAAVPFVVVMVVAIITR
jgi:hypothetical protein